MALVELWRALAGRLCGDLGEIEHPGWAGEYSTRKRTAPRRGRHRHEPTAALRSRVRELRAQRDPRLSIEGIAREIGLGRATLFRHYAAELGSPSTAWLERAPPAAAEGVERLPRGRPRHTPNAEQRALVARMHRDGASQPEIAAAVGVAIGTLRRWYARELDG